MRAMCAWFQVFPSASVVRLAIPEICMGNMWVRPSVDMCASEAFRERIGGAGEVLLSASVAWLPMPVICVPEVLVYESVWAGKARKTACTLRSQQALASPDLLDLPSPSPPHYPCPLLPRALCLPSSPSPLR